MKLKVMEENGVLLVSVLGSRQEMIVSEEDGGFVFELKERVVGSVVVEIAEEIIEEMPVSPPPPPVSSPVSPADEILFNRLSALRRQVAAECKHPPYVIFHDKTLREMVNKMPHNLEELGNITGVGQAKLQKYGDRFLDIIMKHSGVA